MIQTLEEKEKNKMTKKPKTTGEHIIALYGHISGVKKSIDNLKSNHIKHLHSDVDKIDNKIDKITSWIIYGLGSFGIVLLGQLLYILTK